ncbi:MAG: hemin receptor [Alphaproteobacteria bacterium]|nr:hemin receptor [Alphaproteobacteria bacterium]
MQPRPIALVRDSFALFRPNAVRAATLFYGRLFDLDPSLRPLFRRDMAQQAALLAQLLEVAVGSLDRIETIVPALHDLGRRHAAYGVRDEHYETVGTALLWTLEQGLGAAFTAEVRAAWIEAYGLLAATMRAGARAAVVAQAA